MNDGGAMIVAAGLFVGAMCAPWVLLIGALLWLA